MFRKLPSSSPGPKWVALQEPEPSSDDELDTEDGEVDTRRQSGSSQPNAAVGDTSSSQMKRKESESLFTSKKRARYVQAPRSDQDDAMDLDLNDHAKTKINKGINSISAPVQKSMGGSGDRQSGTSLSVSSKTMSRKQPRYGRVPSAPETSRRSSISKTKAIPPDAEIIEISDSPPPSTSKAKSNSKSIRPFPIETLIASKKFLPKVPVEVIEVLDSDEEPLPSKAQHLEQKNVGTSRLSELVQECATGSNPRRGQSRHMSSSGGDSSEGSDGDVGGMNVDEGHNLPQPASAALAVGSAHPIASDNDYPDDLFDIPSSPPASSQVTDDREPIVATAGTSIGSHGNRVGFSHVTVPSSLQAPPTANKHLTQLARKLADAVPEPISDEDEDNGVRSSEPTEKKGAAQIKEDKGKGKEIRHSSSSSSAAESINMRGLRDALVMDLDKPVKRQLVSQTLAEAITSAGQLNRTKKNMGRRLQGNTKDVPIDLTSDVGGKDEPTVDEKEKALKAAIGSSRLLVNFLPTLKQKSSASPGVIADAAKVTEPLASSSQEKPLSLSPPRTQDLVESAESPAIKIERSPYPLSTLSPERNIISRDAPSPQPPPSLPTEIQVKPEPSVGKTLSAVDATTQPQTEQSTAFGFKSGTALIAPPKRIPLPKRPSAATIERILAAGSDGSAGSQRTSPTGTTGLPGEAGESDGDVRMSEVFSRKSMSPMLTNVSATSPSAAATPSLISPPLSPSQPLLMASSTPMPAKPFKRLVPPKRSPLRMTETSLVASSVPGDRDGTSSSRQTPSTSTDGHSSGEIRNDSSVTISSPRKSHSPKLVNVQPALLSSPDVRTQSTGRPPSPAAAAAATQPLATQLSGGNIAASRTIAAAKSPSPKSPISTEVASSHHPTAANTNIVTDAALEAIPQPQTPPSMHPLDSTIASTSNNNVAPPLDTLGLPSDEMSNKDEEECQALLQSPSDDMDVVPSHDVQPSLQDSIVVNTRINDRSDASSSALTSISATAKVFNERTSVSPPVPQVARKSSRRLSRRSSHSSNSEGLGRVFDDDFGPFDSVPATRTPTPQDQEPSASSSLPGSPKPYAGLKTYGGFRALTWKDFRKDLNNFTPKSYYAKDLPHALQDHINNMSEYTQMMPGMRYLFQATILENTVEDEPDAPPIDISNPVDNQSTPPWEFYYTNHMWLGEGVPPPDIKSLVSCACKGGCNPKSKTCACLLRQQEAVGDQHLGFAYDKNGKLQIPGYPIFECNDLCGCSDECRNRVVQHGRKVAVTIRKTETKDWGVFAGPKKIPVGTFIGIYSGELLTDAVAHERGIKYNKFGRTYLFDIDFHHLRGGTRGWENSFTVDAYHAGNFTRYLNHSCDPNCRLYACYINEGNIQKPLLAIFSRRDIEPNEEICFNYQGNYPDNDDDEDSDDENDRITDPNHGTDNIYVACMCGAKNCTGTMFK